MLVNSVNFATVSATNKRKVFFNGNTQSKNQVSFSAHKFPSGVYSDWFVALVKSEFIKESKNPQECAYINLMRNALELREETKKLRGSFSDFFGISEKDITLRKKDIADLLNDLKKKASSSRKQIVYLDIPEGRYSSERDFDRRRKLFVEHNTDTTEEKFTTNEEENLERLRANYPDEWII